MPAGMSQMCPHFYCDRCNNAICRESDKEMAWKEKSSAVLLWRIAGSLPHCPCGGRFSPDASPIVSEPISKPFNEMGEQRNGR